MHQGTDAKYEYCTELKYEDKFLLQNLMMFKFGQKKTGRIG
jgi:hypothetical protein